jgi:omega-hydroxy-beta-dihydromenaquinone-9 sulfotransferase
MGILARGSIRKPVFIIGPGRSGTTILFDVMALHPELAWFSKYTSKFPSVPQLAALSRLHDVAPLERRTREVRAFPRPTESYSILNSCIPGFSSMDGNHRVVTDPEAARLRSVIASHQRWQGKDRFLAKYTGWPRIGMLRGVFADAQFVQIDRDPRAVVGSYMKLKWWFRKKPEVLAAMSVEERLGFYTEKYLGYWRTRRADAQGQGPVQVLYEAFVADPVGIMQGVCEKIGLEMSSSYERAIRSHEMKQDMNDAWKKSLSASEQARFTELLREPLEAMGYLGKGQTTATPRTPMLSMPFVPTPTA